MLTDKGSFPSDTISTHHVHQPGVLRLKRWGLLDEVRASNCPPLTQMSFYVGAFALFGAPPPIEGVAEAFSPRRHILDNILIRAAEQAGAELREGFTVRELTSDSRGVNGIVGLTRRGTPVTEKGRIIIGADGKHSMVARSVGARVYNERPKLTCNYYSYWSGVRLKGTELYIREHRMFVADRTNDGLTMIGVVLLVDEFQRMRSDLERQFMKELELGANGDGCVLSVIVVGVPPCYACVSSYGCSASCTLICDSAAVTHPSRPGNVPGAPHHSVVNDPGNDSKNSSST